ncbi:MAG: mannose-1-phosphate guanylyltransferase/mannose-6-phosphate isomerase [Aquabacterium sp.]
MSILVQPVILAGGSGTRLWPLSRAAHPKQFHVLSGDTSLMQQCVQRLAGLDEPGLQTRAPMVIGNEEHRFLVLEQFRAIDVAPGPILLEPTGRNTAPALTLAALEAMRGGDDPVLVMAPADQTVSDADAFARALRLAVRTAAAGGIVVMGVPPQRPETGYGYIESADAAAAVADVSRFVEKPDAATAERYLAAGAFYWNSGVYVLRASAWLSALDRFRPDILQTVRLAWEPRTADSFFVRPDAAAFAAVPAESVDYAVMERCPGSGIPARVVRLEAGWNDLGAWDAVWQVLPHDALGNATTGDVVAVGCTGSLLHATSRLIGAVGLDDMVVVETPDAVLVCRRGQSQEVKAITAALGAAGRGEGQLHRKVHRPWGWYDSVDAGARFQVKRILVKPGASLSLQKHHHRAEHWIVVSGTAEVTCGDRVQLLTENQSTYIPLGEVHRLANPGKVPLEIIEVQSGSYLGEDDIVRLQDDYGRQRTGS